MRTRGQNFLLIVTLGILNALTPFSIDLFLPAFPEISRDLNVAVARVSLAITIYFLGYALGQIFYGPLLDRYGRKPPLYAGLLIYLVASIGCLRATSLEMLLLFRFVSALGGCAASVAATAMVRDFFPAKDGAKVFSMLMLVLSVSPLLAPSLGSVLVGVWGWRMLFGILSGIAVLDLVLVALVLPKAYAPDPSVELRLAPILRGFRQILAIPRFTVFTLAGSLSFSGLFVFVAGAPAVFMEGFGVSAKAFGLIFALLAGGMIGGGQLNHLLVRRRGSEHVFRAALRVQVIVAALFLATTLAGAMSLELTMIFLFLILLCAGIVYPNAASLALEPLSKNIGSASALLGFLQLGIGSLVAAATGLMTAKGPLPLRSPLRLPPPWVLFI